MKRPCVYLLASKPYSTLHVGATSDVMRRAWEVWPVQEQNPDWRDLYDELNR